jgi:hypothetical protein
MLALGTDTIEAMIKPVGFFRAKTKNLLATCRILVDEHGGQVPRTREALEALPGVGRKTANVVLNNAFGRPDAGVDTHVFRVANRTGLALGRRRSRSSSACSSAFRRSSCQRTSLADPARPLCLRRAPAAVRGLRGRALVRLGSRRSSRQARAPPAGQRPARPTSRVEISAQRVRAALRRAPRRPPRRRRRCAAPGG